MFHFPPGSPIIKKGSLSKFMGQEPQRDGVGAGVGVEAQGGGFTRRLCDKEAPV